MSANKINVISAEEGDAFHALDTEKIIVEVPQQAAVSQKGVWVNIKYDYGGRKDKLKLQTSNLFSYGLSQYEAGSPIKFNLVMSNRKAKEDILEGKTLSEDELLDLQVEDATIVMINDIVAKIKTEMNKPAMAAALQKTKDKKWSAKIDAMEVLKYKESENRIDNVFLYAKLATTSWLKTKFMQLTPSNEIISLPFEETQQQLLQKGVNCKATVILIFDSVFVGKDPYIQVKLGEAVITQMLGSNNSEPDVRVPARLRKPSVPQQLQDKQQITDDFSSDESDSSDDEL
jgi:hypothetical protein